MNGLSCGRFDWDDAFLAGAEAAGRPALRVYRPAETVVVLGAGSRPEREVNLPAAARAAVPVVRRPGGGCAVLLDPGNVIVSVALPLAAAPGIRSTFGRVSGWMIAALARLGLPGVEVAGVSDLTLEGRKIGGSCLHRGRLAYFSGTLLVGGRIGLMEELLPHPPREPEYRQGRPHREFLLNLADLRPALTPAALECGLLETLDLCALVDRP